MDKVRAVKFKRLDILHNVKHAQFTEDLKMTTTGPRLEEIVSSAV